MPEAHPPMNLNVHQSPLCFDQEVRLLGWTNPAIQGQGRENGGDRQGSGYLLGTPYGISADLINPGSQLILSERVSLCHMCVEPPSALSWSHSSNIYWTCNVKNFRTEKGITSGNEESRAKRTRWAPTTYCCPCYRAVSPSGYLQMTWEGRSVSRWSMKIHVVFNAQLFFSVVSCFQFHIWRAH